MADGGRLIIPIEKLDLRVGPGPDDLIGSEQVASIFFNQPVISGRSFSMCPHRSSVSLTCRPFTSLKRFIHFTCHKPSYRCIE